MYYEGYRAIGNAGIESIKLVVFLCAIYFLFIIVGEVILLGTFLFMENPNLFIPIIFFIVLALTWRISSSTSQIDNVIGFFAIHLFSFLAPCLAYYYIYTILSIDIINGVTAYNQQALQWIQSFDSFLYYGAWTSYIFAFALILTIFALPIYLSRKAGKNIIYHLHTKGLYIAGDIIIISIILTVTIFLLSVMNYDAATEMLQSFEINAVVLVCTSLLTAIIGWRKLNPYSY